MVDLHIKLNKLKKSNSYASLITKSTTNRINNEISARLSQYNSFCYAKLCKNNIQKTERTIKKIKPKANKIFYEKMKLNSLMKKSTIINRKDRSLIKEIGEKTLKQFNSVSDIESAGDNGNKRFAINEINKFKEKCKSYQLHKIYEKNMESINKRNFNHNLYKFNSCDNIQIRKPLKTSLLLIKKVTEKKNFFEKLISAPKLRKFALNKNKNSIRNQMNSLFNALKNVNSFGKFNSKNNRIKSLIKLESINWLWINKKLLLEKLLISLDSFKWFFDKNEVISKTTFLEFNLISKLCFPMHFINQIYDVFSYDTHPDLLNISHFKSLIILCSSSRPKSKISNILSILSSGTNTINKNKLLTMLYSLFVGEEFNKYILDIQNEINQKFKEDNIEKDELENLFESNQHLNSLIEILYKKYIYINNIVRKEICKELDINIDNNLNCSKSYYEEKCYNQKDYEIAGKLHEIMNKYGEKKEKLNQIIEDEEYKILMSNY